MKTTKLLLFIATMSLGAVLSACSATPGGSPSLPAVSLPPMSIDPSAASSTVLLALDEVDAQIDANQTAAGLTVEERDALKDIVARIRTAVDTGDLSAAQPAVDELSAKLTELDAKLGTDTGTRLKDTVALLEALLAAS